MSWVDNELMDQISGSIFDAAHTTPKNDVGRCARYRDGRVFVYVRTDSDFNAGQGLQQTPNVQAIAATEFVAAAAGATEITVSASGITANEYAGGYLNIIDGTGEGHVYRVKKNTTTVITIYDGLSEAIDATASVGELTHNPCYDVAAFATNGIYAGVAMVNSTAGTGSTVQYLWAQKCGVASVLVGTGGATAGAAISPQDGGDFTDAASDSLQVGQFLTAGLAAEHTTACLYGY